MERDIYSIQKKVNVKIFNIQTLTLPLFYSYMQLLSIIFCNYFCCLKNTDLPISQIYK